MRSQPGRGNRGAEARKLTAPFTRCNRPARAGDSRPARRRGVGRQIARRPDSPSPPRPAAPHAAAGGVRRGDRRRRVRGRGLLVLLGSGSTRREALEAKLQETLTELRDTVGAAVYISRYIDGEVKITQMADGRTRRRSTSGWTSARRPTPARSASALLTQLDQNGRRDHLSRHKIARLTSRTITSERVLFSKLDSQPPTVPVLDLQEYAVGTVCARCADGRVVRGLPGAVPPDRARPPPARGGRHAEPQGGAGGAVAGPVSPATRLNAVGSTPRDRGSINPSAGAASSVG